MFASSDWGHSLVSAAEIRLGRMGKKDHSASYAEFEVPTGDQVELMLYSKKLQ